MQDFDHTPTADLMMPAFERLGPYEFSDRPTRLLPMLWGIPILVGLGVAWFVIALARYFWRGLLRGRWQLHNLAD